MSKNRGVVYVKPGVVEVRDIADPKFEECPCCSPRRVRALSP
jgi:hypothetical protein